MIIRTFSDKETEFAKGFVMMAQATGHEVILAPHRARDIFISTDGSEAMNLVVIVSDGSEELHVATGFERVADCWSYARKVAKAAGLSEEIIDSDVWESVTTYE